MKLYPIAFAALFCLLLEACSTVPPDNNHSEALALATENSSGILLMAALPIRYYCDHGRWPNKFEPPLQDRELLTSISDLRYHRDDNDYAASFVLHSFIPGDNFLASWHMTIVPPDLKKEGPQVVPIALVAKQYHIFIPFEYEYNCKHSTQIG